MKLGMLYSFISVFFVFQLSSNVFAKKSNVEPTRTLHIYSKYADWVPGGRYVGYEVMNVFAPSLEELITLYNKKNKEEFNSCVSYFTKIGTGDCGLVEILDDIEAIREDGLNNYRYYKVQVGYEEGIYYVYPESGIRDDLSQILLIDSTPWFCPDGYNISHTAVICIPICDCDEVKSKTGCDDKPATTSVSWSEKELYTHDDHAEKCTNDLADQEAPSCQKNGNDVNKGNPINCATGEKVQIETDYMGQGLDPLNFTRQYSTNLSKANYTPDWRVAYSAPSLTKRVFSDGAVLYTFRDGGVQLTATSQESDFVPSAFLATQRYLFKAANSNTYSTSSYYEPILMPEEGREIIYQGKTYRFDDSGMAVTVSEKNNSDAIRYRYVYTMINDVRLLTRVENRFGRYLDYHYDETGRLQSLVDQDGYTIKYAYDKNNNLTQVIYPDATLNDDSDNPTRQYVFENNKFPGYLTGIIDEEGNRFATFSYNEFGKAISTEHFDGAEKVEVSYPEDGKAIVKFFRDVESDAYRQETYSYAKFRGRYQLTAKTITKCDNCELTTETWDYNDAELLERHTDPAGVITEWVYDSKARKIKTIVAKGTDQEQTTTYTWNETHNAIDTITTKTDVTTYTFDERGNRIATVVTPVNSGQD